MKRLLIAGALAFAAIGQALAADLPQPAPLPPRAPAMYIPTIAPVYNWGGIYYGINGGYGFGSSEWTDPANASGLGSTGDFNISGFVVGPTIGANFQTDAFVFGVEGDIDYSSINGSTSSAFCNATGFAACETKNTWLSTIRGRVGYAVDRVLFYGTGGGAFGNIEAGANGAANSTFASSTKAGWTAGAGVEVAFADNWTARVEYLFVDLQNSTCNTAGCGFDPGGVVANQIVKFDANLVRLGFDCKFR
jgi:outer membrane immunogenic protein